MISSAMLFGSCLAQTLRTRILKLSTEKYQQIQMPKSIGVRYVAEATVRLFFNNKKILNFLRLTFLLVCLRLPW